tara:strand:- start:50019 stop:51140 length:1122 start_codon:yes stop_codon:yes gene_type:complete
MSEKSASKIPVLIASSLKPAKDTRAYGKLGLSLRETGVYSLNFMGFSQIPYENCEGENFYTSVSKANPSWGRLSAQGRFLSVLVKVRPKILICCTYEYLPIAAFFKPFFGYKLVYDVQENYVKNLQLNPKLSPAKRARLGKIIQRMEYGRAVDLYLFAEKCYVEEMPDKTPFLVLKNKYAGEIRHVNPLRFEKKSGYNFLISGTLTPAFGTLDAVNWFKEIIKEFPDSSLKIIGHCTLLSFKKELEKACENTSQIQLKHSSFPVPHEEIIAEYSTADFAILPYQNREAIKDKIPTKLFESAALGIPVLIGGNPKWLDFIAPYSGGFPIDFFDLAQSAQQFNAALNLEYFTQSPAESILWKSQHSDFISAIASL